MEIDLLSQNLNVLSNNYSLCSLDVGPGKVMVGFMVESMGLKGHCE